jgi:hypothetical protein
MAAISLYPTSVKEDLVKQFVGRSIKDVGTPVAVLDISKLENNCNRMLEACASLEFEWRAHIKTHKVLLNQLLYISYPAYAVYITASWDPFLQFSLIRRSLQTVLSTFLQNISTSTNGVLTNLSTKTIELTRLQVGPGIGPVNLIVSTLIEAEFILPLLLEYKSQGRAVNVCSTPRNSFLSTN